MDAELILIPLGLDVVRVYDPINVLLLPSNEGSAQRGKRGESTSRKWGPQIQKKIFGEKYIILEEECRWFHCFRCHGLRFMGACIGGVGTIEGLFCITGT